MKRKIGLPLLLVGLAVTAVPAGAAEVAVRSLAGPPEEFASKRLPSAAETAVPYSFLLLDRGQRGPGGKNLPPGPTTSTFNTEPGVGFNLVQASSQHPYFPAVILTAPNRAQYVFDGSTITCNSGVCGEFQANLLLEPFTAGAQQSVEAGGMMVFSISGGEVSGGTWTVEIQSPPVPPGSIDPVKTESLVSFDDVVEVEIEPEPCPSGSICPQKAGGEARRNATFDLVEGAAPVLRLSYATRAMKRQGERSGIGLTSLGVTVTDTRTQKAFHREKLGIAAALWRDGSGANLVQLPALPAGEYSIRLDLEGEVPGFGRIERTAFYFLPILPRRYEMTGYVRTEVIDDRRLKLVLDLETLKEDTRHVYAYAEVWTGDGEKPIAWIGGMTQPEPGPYGNLGLPLVLDTRWLALAGASGPELLLRNVRIQDADTFIPLDQLAELPFTVRELPKAASLATAVVKDDSLYRGLGDRTIFVEGAGSSGSEDKACLPSRTGIILVHGWCSVPVWPAWHFSRPGGTWVFSDPSASRSHDAFAQRIRDMGHQCVYRRFSLVAHSQGGAAALHLRSFYASPLDFSIAPRRIQTMGTPYFGSTLMDLYLGSGPLGWLIASIFGQCAPQFSLSTPGSALWLSSIPGWARSEVFYYRTGHQRPRNFVQRLQFWRWRCNAGSFVIPSWDDGVVADFQGFLPGGQNQGITEGECHTGGMNHPSQTNNFNRNDFMDSQGRP